jgi:hypothetical protein
MKNGPAGMAEVEPRFLSRMFWEWFKAYRRGSPSGDNTCITRKPRPGSPNGVFVFKKP